MLTRRTFALTLGALPAALSGAPSDKQQAQKAAEAWLALVDAEDYDQSWETAAAFFKQNVSKQQWARMAAKARKPFGALKSRELAGSRVETSLPGAPDGEYVVMQYKAVYANKAKAVETITPMKDPDGVWRVSGYFIR